jgi:hypothetical protein
MNRSRCGQATSVEEATLHLADLRAEAEAVLAAPIRDWAAWVVEQLDVTGLNAEATVTRVAVDHPGYYLIQSAARTTTCRPLAAVATGNPAPPAADATIAAIDAATRQLCGCGCNRPIPDWSPSAYFVDDDHQDMWYRAQTLSPDQVDPDDPADYLYPTGPMRWAPNLTMTDPGPIDPVSAAENAALRPRDPMGGFNPTWGLRDGRYVLRLDDGNRYVERFIDTTEVTDDLVVTVGRLEAAWHALECDLTDRRQLDGISPPPDPRQGTYRYLVSAEPTITQVNVPSYRPQYSTGRTWAQRRRERQMRPASPLVHPARETRWHTLNFLDGRRDVIIRYDTGWEIDITYHQRDVHVTDAITEFRTNMRRASTTAEQWAMIENLGVIARVRPVAG